MHATKAYSVRRIKAASILYLVSTGRRMTKFTFRPLYPKWKKPHSQLNRSVFGAHRGPGFLDKVNISCPLSGNRSPARSARNTINKTTALWCVQCTIITHSDERKHKHWFASIKETFPQNFMALNVRPIKGQLSIARRQTDTCQTKTGWLVADECERTLHATCSDITLSTQSLT